MEINLEKVKVCIIGLGYVGMPLAEAFANKLEVIGYDINAERITSFNKNINKLQNLTFTNDPESIRKADFNIICVPTPVTSSKEPDLNPVESAAITVGKYLKKGSVTVLESTVYPGVTEEVLQPILEQESGLKCGEDFKIAYAPERVNPGDKEHTIEKIVKVVSGMDEETAELVEKLYSKIFPNVYKAKNIKTAEAAKVIENIQRDLNIALVNELSLIFDKLNLDTKDVIDTAATKWNFHVYSPGLVGGHCIPVDPYYLVYRAKKFGYEPQVILAGRSINDSMAKHVAEMTIKALNSQGKVIKESSVLIMGLTYKENVADTRETPVKQVIKELQEFEVTVYGYDPLLDFKEAKEEYHIEILDTLEDGHSFDGIILAVPHDIFKEKDDEICLNKLEKITGNSPVLFDIKRCLDAKRAEGKGFKYLTL